MAEKKRKQKIPLRASARGRPPKPKSTDSNQPVNIGVAVDDGLWRRLRALAMIQGKVTGALLDEAIEEYLKKQN